MSRRQKKNFLADISSNDLSDVDSEEIKPKSELAHKYKKEDTIVKRRKIESSSEDSDSEYDGQVSLKTDKHNHCKGKSVQESNKANNVKKVDLFDSSDDDNDGKGAPDAHNKITQKNNSVNAKGGTYSTQGNVYKCKEQSPGNENPHQTSSTLTINKNYADQYDQVKRKQELQRLMSKYEMEGLLDSDEDEEIEAEEGSEDDEAVLLKDVAAEEIFADVLLKLKQNDPSLKDPKNSFFKGIAIGETLQVEKQTNKAFTLRDEYRRGLMSGNKSKDGEGSNDDDDNEEDLPERTKKLRPSSIIEKDAKAAFLKAVGDVKENNDAEDNDDDLIVKRKEGGLSSAELFGKDKSSKSKVASSATDSVKIKLKQALSSDSQGDVNETFLQDYFVNELWKEDNVKDKKEKKSAKRDEIGDGVQDLDWEQIVKDEQEDDFYFNAEQWEKEFQAKEFRHETVDNPEDLQVKTFARRVPGSGVDANVDSEGNVLPGMGDGLLRARKSARKEARERKAERDAKTESRQVEELKRLKTLKRMEIEEQRKMIAKVAGILRWDEYEDDHNVEVDGVHATSDLSKKSIKKASERKKSQLEKVWSKEDLMKDFDPEEFDKKMAQLFDEEYNNDIDEDEMALIKAELGEDDDEMDMYDDLEGDGGELQETDGDSHNTYPQHNDNGLFEGLDDVLGAPHTSSSKSKGDKIPTGDGGKKRGNKAAKNSLDAAYLENDDLALLYPSKVLAAIEHQSLNSDAEDDDNDGDNRSTSLKKEEKEKQRKLKEARLNELKDDLETKIDEYNKLHYDTVLEGGLKTRFKYRQVNSETFGLSNEDILTMDDRTLNMIAPMNCYSSYLGPKENFRDRQKCLARLANMRTLDPSRKSKKYGKNVSSTIIFDPKIEEEEGEKLAANVEAGTSKLLKTYNAIPPKELDEGTSPNSNYTDRHAMHNKRPREYNNNRDRYNSSEHSRDANHHHFRNTNVHHKHTVGETSNSNHGFSRGRGDLRGRGRGGY